MWFNYSVSVCILSTTSPALALSPPTAEVVLEAFMGGVGAGEVSEKKALLPCSILVREVNMIKWPSNIFWDSSCPQGPLPA